MPAAMPPRPWLGHYEPGVPADLLPNRSLIHAVLGDSAATAPGLPAMAYFGRAITYGELDQEADRVGAALRHEGVGPGDVVAAALWPGPALVSVAFGTLRAGATFMPLKVGSDPAAVLHGNGVSPRVVFAGPSDVQRLLEVAPSVVMVPRHHGLPGAVGWLARWLTGVRATGHAQSWREWLRSGNGPAMSAEEPDGPALVFVGREGPTVFSHRQVAAGVAMLRAWLTDIVPTLDVWAVAASHARPFGFVAGVALPLELHARLVFVAPEDLCGLAAELDGAPYYVVADPEVGLPEAWPAPPRAWITHCGPTQRTDPDPHRVLREGLALDASAGLVACPPINGPWRPGSVGLPLPGVDVGLDPSGREEDRLFFRGPNLARSDWVRSEFRGKVGPDGFLEVSGRNAALAAALSTVSAGR